MNRLTKFFIVCIAAFPLTLFAEGIDQVVPGLDKSFNFTDYQKCHEALHQCPASRNTPFLDRACAEKVMQANAFCTQLDTIAKFVGMDPEFITVTNDKSRVAIIKVIYPADGAEVYYLLTAKNRMIATNSDPRTFDAKLKDQYPNANFYTQNNGEPTVQTRIGDTMTVKAPIMVMDGCKACKVLLKANVNYDFASNGDFIKATVN